MTPQSKPTDNKLAASPAAATAADAVVRLAGKEWGKLGAAIASVLVMAGGWALTTASNITSQLAELKAQNPPILASIAELKNSITEVKTDVKSSISRLERRQDKQDERMLNLERDTPRRGSPAKGADDE